MPADSRLAQLAAAFRSTPLSIAGRELRRPTPGSIDLLLQLENPLFTAPEGDPSGGDELDISDADALRGVLEFIWIHRATVEDLENLPLDPAEMRKVVARKVRGMSLELEFEDLQEFSSRFALIRERLESTLTEPVEDPAPGKPPGETLPTGLPPWSMPSAVPETPSASDGSSGTSPSSEPSNTSTPPRSTTATASDTCSSPGELVDPMPLTPSADAAPTG